MNFNDKSPKYIAAKESLPEDLQPLFAALVNDYAFFALKNYGKNWVAYAVLAELVKTGWRPPDKAQSSERDPR